MSSIKHIFVRDEMGEDWFTGRAKLYRTKGKESSGVSMFFLKAYILLAYYKLRGW